MEWLLRVGVCLAFTFTVGSKRREKGRTGIFPQAIQRLSKLQRERERERERGPGTGSKALFEFSFTSKKGVFVSGITRVP
jgi:hypothetical protein